MSNDLVLPLVIGLALGAVFFLIDIYNENKTKEINTSLIAGVTITYFFIILLPEIEVGLEESHLGIYKFLGVLIGFSTVHLTEKLILQRVEEKSQIKLKEICEEEEILIKQEKKVEKSLINKLVENDQKDILPEKLYALKEIKTIQGIWLEEEKNLKEKLYNADLNKYSYLILLSELKEISKIQVLCVEEVKKIEDSILKNLRNNNLNSSLEDLNKKLLKIDEIRQLEMENMKKKRELERYLIKSLVAERKDKISKEEFKEKLFELEDIYRNLKSYFKNEQRMRKVSINDIARNKSEIRASKNLYALEIIQKIRETYIEKEMKYNNSLMKSGQDNFSLLKKLLKLKHISGIKIKCLEVEMNVEKALVRNIQEGGILSEKYTTLQAINEAEVATILQQKSLQEELISRLMVHDSDFSKKEFNEKLEQLGIILRVQEEFVGKEKNIERAISSTINFNEGERFSLQDLAQQLNNFCQLEEQLEEQDIELKTKIQNHINEHLDELHLYTNFIYHLLIGIILFELLTHDFITAGLFFIFALFKAITSKTSNDITLFPDIKIEEEHHEPLYIKIIVASAALIGVLTGLIFTVVFNISMEIIFLLFSFISGVILYTIIREVLPENESGRPLYFFIGIILFLIIITVFELTLSLFTTTGH